MSDKKYQSAKILLLILFLSGAVIRCDAAEVIGGQFSGSNLTEESMISKCDAIFVGKVLTIGEPTGAAPGRGDYSGVHVAVIQNLLGSISNDVFVTLYVCRFQNYQETKPAAGDAFIFFVRNRPEHPSSPYLVLKLLAATSDNVTKVEGLIAEKSAAK